MTRGAMDDLLDRLEDRVARAADQLRELAVERVRLAEEVGALNQRLRELERRPAARDPEGPVGVAERPVLVGALREALAVLRGS